VAGFVALTTFARFDIVFRSPSAVRTSDTPAGPLAIAAAAPATREEASTNG